MSSSNRYAPEVRERAIQLVFEHRDEYEVGWSALPYSWTEFQIPADGACLGSGGTADPDDPVLFANAISVGKVKKGWSV